MWKSSYNCAVSWNIHHLLFTLSSSHYNQKLKNIDKMCGNQVIIAQSPETFTVSCLLYLLFISSRNWKTLTKCVEIKSLLRKQDESSPSRVHFLYLLSISNRNWKILTKCVKIKLFLRSLLKRSPSPVHFIFFSLQPET